jgi:hypothetical protein
MSQNARVARWVPSLVPSSVGQGVVTTAGPLPSGVLPTKFAAAGGGGGSTDYASDADLVVGTEPLKAVSPATLRTELAREFGIATALFANPIAIAVRSGTAADIGMLIKTDATGRIDTGFLPTVIDGGTF